jgi:AmmeMemoRadiSam system protein A
VTLQKEGALRGCIGTFDAQRPLVENVAASAFRSAFEDPRFPPATAPELPRLEVEISVLSRPGPFVVESREELLARLEPGVDGLIVSEGLRRATFLPAVWESLPEPEDFVEALFRKAGLARGHWSGTLRFERYTATKAD